jgi:hypothetical protein
MGVGSAASILEDHTNFKSIDPGEHRIEMFKSGIVPVPLRVVFEQLEDIQLIIYYQDFLIRYSLEPP